MLTAPLRRCLTLAFLILASTSTVCAGDWIYTVKPGDNPWSISRAHLKDWRQWKALSRYNHIPDDRRIRPGTRLRIPEAWLRTEPLDIEVVHVSGKVVGARESGEQATDLTPGDRLLVGGHVETGGDTSSVALRLSDGSETTLHANSRLEIRRARAFGGEQKSDIHLHQEQGRSETRAFPDHQPDARFEISTPAANSSVRGTRFRVAADPGGSSTRTEVLAGAVGVSNSLGRARVAEGFGTLTRAGEPPSPPRRLLQAPDLGEVTEVLRYLPGRLSWSGLAGARSYRVRLARADDPAKAILQREVSAGLSISGDLPDGSYLLFVRGVDAQGLEGFEARKDFKVDARPFPPVLSAPLDGVRQLHGPVRLQWAAPEGVERFELTLAKDARMQRPIVHLSDVTDTAWTSQPLPPGDYYWRLSSVSVESKLGPPSEVGQFSLKATPPTPEAEDPSIDGEHLALGWRALEGIVEYRVQLARDSEFSDLLLERTMSDTRITIDRPPAGIYFLRMQSVDEDGFVGPYSAAQRIEVEPSSYWPLGIFGAAVFLLLL